MSHKHNIAVGIITLIFLAAIIGLNIYSLLPNSNWYQFIISIIGQQIIFGVNRGGLEKSGSNNIEWNSDSESRTTIYISFAFVIASFLFSCIMILITFVALFKRVHKKGRKALFTLSIFVFIFNVLATLTFLRLNKAICNDFSNGLSLGSSFEKNIDNTDLCSKFKGSENVAGLAGFSWGPTVGWYCSVAAASVSFITIFLASSILKTKRFGYRVIH